MMTAVTSRITRIYGRSMLLVHRRHRIAYIRLWTSANLPSLTSRANKFRNIYHSCVRRSSLRRWHFRRSAVRRECSHRCRTDIPCSRSTLSTEEAFPVHAQRSHITPIRRAFSNRTCTLGEHAYACQDVYQYVLVHVHVHVRTGDPAPR